MKTSLPSAAFPVLVLNVVLLSGCMQSTTAPPHQATEMLPPTGSECHVHLKRSSLGLTSSNGVGPLVDGHNGSELSIIGKLENIGTDWLVVSTPKGRVWIARPEVLAIQLYGK